MTPKNKPYQNSYDFSNIYSLSPTALASALHLKHNILSHHYGINPEIFYILYVQKPSHIRNPLKEQTRPIG